LRRFVTRLGPAATKKIFLTGRTLDAEEMLRIGYLTELVGRGALPEAVEAYRSAIAESAPGVVRSMKRHIDGLAAGTWPEKQGREAYEASLRRRARSPARRQEVTGHASGARSVVPSHFRARTSERVTSMIESLTHSVDSVIEAVRDHASEAMRSILGSTR
jgi:enoyl-CoA hydratase/carnithine racemase